MIVLQRYCRCQSQIESTLKRAIVLTIFSSFGLWDPKQMQWVIFCSRLPKQSKIMFIQLDSLYSSFKLQFDASKFANTKQKKQNVIKYKGDKTFKSVFEWTRAPVWRTSNRTLGLIIQCILPWQIYICTFIYVCILSTSSESLGCMVNIQ